MSFTSTLYIFDNDIILLAGFGGEADFVVGAGLRVIPEISKRIAVDYQSESVIRRQCEDIVAGVLGRKYGRVPPGEIIERHAGGKAVGSSNIEIERQRHMGAYYGITFHFGIVPVSRRKTGFTVGRAMVKNAVEYFFSHPVAPFAVCKRYTFFL